MNLSFDFMGQSVIVTGGARGIGLELGRFFADSGADVFLIDYDGEEVRKAAAEVGVRAIPGDVSSTGDIDRAVEQVIAATGRIDVIVNNAGILRDKVLWKLTDDDWKTVLAIHTGGTFRLTRACVPHFHARGYGRVVNVTSYTGLHGNTGQANYATAKAGIIGFTKTAAKELARFGVTVNAISPNAETRMVASIPENKKAELASGIPLGSSATLPRCAPRWASSPPRKRATSPAWYCLSTAGSRSDQEARSMCRGTDRMDSAA